ncbi:DUF1232 domain-containing protein [Thermosynechococcus sp. PP42]|uniref:YkvA family protein n=1 Tax=Thermosynechococcus sp. PP42 TaxID=3074083 RepID=UPI00286324D8|nr:DUF1232 domain-containing protein [Thermosynechococcus sp. PP42]MDR5639607.1 DUF1232 domain-containing protein [Thermosynechococcus sp. PP42]
MSGFYNWYRNVLRHPKYRWLIIAASLIYLLSPLDISPDLVPIIGQFDDVTVMVILASELTQLLVERIIVISKGSEIFSRGIGYTQRVMNVTQEYEL